MRLLVASALALLGAGLAACPSPKMPSGPPPEYEDPPPPSWLGDAAAAPQAPAPGPLDTLPPPPPPGPSEPSPPPSLDGGTPTS